MAETIGSRAPNRSAQARALWPLASALLALAALGAAGCGASNVITPIELDGGADGASDTGDPPRDAPRESGSMSGNPILLAVRPDHGPFNGGTNVVLRGSNFTEGLSVRFGGSLVQPRYLSLMDRNRLVVERTPEGNPGPVDVTIERDDGYRSRLANGFTYDSFYADPSDGSIAGGTRITLRGRNTNWTAGTRVVVDASPCTELTLVSPSEIQCTVPPHAQGAVPITVSTGADAITVAEAFTYRETGDSNYGGFSGGPIRGSINVSVYNQLTGDAIPAAFVYTGENPLVLPPRSGVTNARGQTTLSSPDLMGPVTITAVAKCFASSTFVSINGRDATIFLIPWLDRVPGVDCGMGMPPDGGTRPPIYAATVQGELVWPGPNEFGPNPWSNIPRARANERRVAYVMTTVGNIFSGTSDPGAGGTVLEVVPDNYGGRGYAYDIVARPAAMAVYALAGLERTDTSPPRFTPYVMGVARSVLGSPRAMLTGVDIDMTIPLDHETVVTLSDPPAAENNRPNNFRVEAWIDLGGEGVIPRADSTVTGRTVADPYRVVSLPAFQGTLADARLTLRATYGSGSNFEEPSTTVLLAGITSPDDPVTVRNWVGIPSIAEPMDGGSLPESRRLRIDLRGAEPDMFWSVLSQAGSSCRYGFYLGDVVWWQHYFPGTAREIAMPDISMIPTLTDIPSGIYQLSVCGFRVNGFDYNTFRYQYLSSFYWTAFSSSSATLVR